MSSRTLASRWGGVASGERVGIGRLATILLEMTDALPGPRSGIWYRMRTPMAALAGAVLALSLAACSGAETDADDASLETAPLAASPARRNFFTLTNAPFADTRHATALVYLPRGFNPAGPLNLVVHFHGWANCIENDGEATGTACTPGGPVRTPHNYIAQLDASGANAALVLIERAYDQSSSADGKLSQSGFFRAMIDELLPHIGALAGRTYAESDVGEIALSSHSGGYLAVADALSAGGLTNKIHTVMLFDSLYGNLAQYEAWLRPNLGKIRFSLVYTDGGGTLANSQALAALVKQWLAAAHLPASTLIDDRTTSTFTDAQFATPIIFKHSALAHDATASYYFSRFVRHAF